MKKRATHGLHNHIFIDKSHRKGSSKKENNEKDDANNASINYNNNNNINSDLLCLTNNIYDTNTDKTNVKKTNKTLNTGI